MWDEPAAEPYVSAIKDDPVSAHGLQRHSPMESPCGEPLRRAPVESPCGESMWRVPMESPYEGSLLQL